jgi:hypothetical protein
MTNKPTRQRSTAFIRASTESGIWSTIATYANELAPVAGPLLAAIGNTALAVDRAEHRNRCLEGQLAGQEWDQ